MATKKQVPQVPQDQLTGAPAVESTAEEKPGLTVNDIALMVQVLQLSTSRGTFKADELTTVGGLYDRVSKFLAAVSPPQDTTKE